MTSTLRIILFICIAIYFFAVIRLLKKGYLALKYSLLWLFMGTCLLLLVIFPQMLKIVCRLFGIVDTMNGLFTLAIGFILVLLMALTSIASKQSDKIKNLIQDNALLEKRIRDLERKVKE